MADRVKVYEEGTRKKLPIWAWLLPLLLLFAVMAYFLTRHHDEPTATSPAVRQATSATSAGALPNLGTVHFDTNKATLTPESQAILQRAAAAMKSNPNAHLRLEGYTDSTGDPSHNLSLSQQRTMTVANFLKGQGIDGSRLTGGGFGPSNPADTNATSSGKADNRRVEFFSQQ